MQSPIPERVDVNSAICRQASPLVKSTAYLKKKKSISLFGYLIRGQYYENLVLSILN